jgi:hypothetical protein
MRALLLMVLLAGAAMAGQSVLIIEAAPTDEGPWVAVPIGPEAIDLRGAIVWQGLPAEWKFVRVRVVAPEPANIEAVDCFCDTCQGTPLE